MRKPILKKEIKSPPKVGRGVDIINEKILNKIIMGEAREKTQIKINLEKELKVVSPNKEAPGKILQRKARGRVIKKPQYLNKVMTEILKKFALRMAYNIIF